MHHDSTSEAGGPEPLSPIAASLAHSAPGLCLGNLSPNHFVDAVQVTCKYNFCQPLDAGLDGERRIAVLQDRLAELKKTYLTIKAEMSSMERRRRKAGRGRERHRLEGETHEADLQQALQQPSSNLETSSGGELHSS